MSGARNPARSGHVVRDLSSIEEYRACVELQEETWGRGFSERVPTAILKVGQRLGGVSAGAFGPDGRLDGLVFGLTGLDEDGGLLHWSDMLAVRGEAAGRGLGVRLKSFQREAVLGRGVRRMAWSFDPLRARNAHFNLNKLGAVVREYRRDMYGETDSKLHRGIGTDRFLALWLLDSERTEDRLTRALRAGGPRSDPPDDEGHAPTGPLDPLVVRAVPDGASGLVRPSTPVLDLHDASVGVAVPTDIGVVMERAPELAVAWRVATRDAFVHYLERGYEVTALVRPEPARPCATYRLERRGP